MALSPVFRRRTKNGARRRGREGLGFLFLPVRCVRRRISIAGKNGRGTATTDDAPWRNRFGRPANGGREACARSWAQADSWEQLDEGRSAIHCRRNRIGCGIWRWRCSCESRTYLLYYFLAAGYNLLGLQAVDFGHLGGGFRFYVGAALASAKKNYILQVLPEIVAKKSCFMLDKKACPLNLLSNLKVERSYRSLKSKSSLKIRIPVKFGF